MEKYGATPIIRTLGRFSISVNGKTVATEWPDETIKVVFCSLLSPLDLYFTWDRMCRSLWGVPVTRTNRRRLEEVVIRPLTGFLTGELGFSPLLVGREGIRVDHQGVQVDAHDFYGAVIDGLRLLSLSNNGAAVEKFILADSLYAGTYLPDMKGKIIENARLDLASLYQAAVKKGSWYAPAPDVQMKNRINVLSR